MHRKVVTTFLLALATGITWLLSTWLEPQTTADKLFYSVATLFGLYVILSLAVEETLARRFTDTKMRYTFRKAVSVILIVLVLIVLLRIWIPNPEALLVAYGVVTAGVAIALQDVVKNLAGSLFIFFGGLYQVGNRIEINDTQGDVIDIGLFSTRLLEIGNAIEADQATGRITAVPNGTVLSRPVYNYTKHHQYLWDEIVVTVTSESAWQRAMQVVEEIGLKHTGDFIQAADESLSNLERYYYVGGHTLKPNVYVAGADYGYALTMRYVVDAWQRRSTKSAIWHDIIVAFEQDGAIEIAPPMTVVYDAPASSGSATHRHAGAANS